MADLPTKPHKLKWRKDGINGATCAVCGVRVRVHDGGGASGGRTLRWFNGRTRIEAKPAKCVRAKGGR